MNASTKLDDSSVGSPDALRTAQTLLRQNRQQGLAALNALFRAGRPPQPALDGPYAGELVAVTLAPGVSQIVQWLTALWMPWKGKHLNAAENNGDNILYRSYRLLFRILFPFYRGIIENDPQTFRAFAFKTSLAPGKADPDIQVLKIDYDSPENPALSIRPIVDEVVQIADGIYLGKIHFKWWLFGWSMIGYFALRSQR